MKWIKGLLVATIVASGCGSDSSDKDPDHGHHHNDAHDHYSEGMTKTSTDGKFRVSFRSDPPPASEVVHVLTLGISDADGAVVENADVTLEAWMPHHGHGVDREPVVVEEGGGVYRIEEVELTMPGLWELRIDVQHESASDRVVFIFDVE